MKRVYLSSPDEIRAASLALARMATVPQQNHGDRLFDWITEHRQGPGYSACADLCHWVCWCLGCRDERLINRDSDGGTKPWQISVNLNRFYANPLMVKGRIPEPGDITLVCCDWHLCVWEQSDTLFGGNGIAHTYDYGQFDAKLGKACGKRVTREFAWPKLGNRTIYGSLDVTKLELTESAWVPNNFGYGEPDDNPYPEPLPIDPTPYLSSK